MFTNLVPLFAFIVIQEVGWLVPYAPTLVDLAHGRIQRIVYRCYGPMRSASWLRKSQAISIGAVVAMHAVVLGWVMSGVMSGVVLPALPAVIAAIVICAGFAVIASAAVARMASGLWGPSPGGAQ